MQDPDLQAAFERDGYVVVDLLEPGAVADMIAEYEALDHEDRTEWPFADGFHTSIYDSRRSYRSAVLASFETHIAPRLDEVMERYRIFFANYTVKMPHGAEVPLHVDWTFLDERRYSSATVWCPLMDTDVDNGTLGIVAGSQDRIDFLRIVNVPCYDRSEAAVADLQDRPVLPLRAGQAIIMDNRTVHFSPPNTTDGRRIAAACVVGPVEADLHHYWLDDTDEVHRYQLDPEFFLSYSVGRPPAEADGVRGVDILPAGTDR